MRLSLSSSFAIASCVASVVSLTCLPCESSAQEWTRFHGPNGQGVVPDATLPDAWSAEDYAWTVDLPGQGNSSPTLWGEKLFLFSADPTTATRYALCYDANSGEKLWQKDFPSTPHHLHGRNSYASCTPACDAERVYFAWSTETETLLTALDHDGELVWSVDLGPWVSQHGFATSPMLVDGLVVLNANQEGVRLPPGVRPGKSYLVAFDAETGVEKWRVARKSTNLSYSVPCVRATDDGSTELVCSTTSEGLFAVDPRTGKINWEIGVFDKRTVSSPVLAGGYVFGSTGSGGGGNYIVAVKPGDEPAEAYRERTAAPYVPTSVTDGDLMYLFNDRGVVSAIEIATGEVVWRERASGEFSSSPVLIGDKVLCVNDAGEALVLRASDEYEKLGSTSLGQPSRATPAVANGCVYFRTDAKLLCLPIETN